MAELYTSLPDGSQELHVSVPSIRVQQHAWSPDGKHLAFDRGRLTATLLTFDGHVGFTSPQWPGVWVAGAKGAGQQVVTGARNSGAGTWQP
jgi:Tol biopolymer transport system component